MARKGRRKFRRYIKGNIDLEVPFTNLSGSSLVKTDVQDVLTEAAYISSMKATWAMGEYTPVLNTGPILVGVAHSDYTAAEIEEWVELATGWDGGDKVSREIARRQIRRVGVFETPQAVEDQTHLNDGKPIRTKIGWSLSTGQTLAVWVYNSGSAQVSTSAPEIKVNGHANIWPR